MGCAELGAAIIGGWPQPAASSHSAPPQKKPHRGAGLVGRLEQGLPVRRQAHHPNAQPHHRLHSAAPALGIREGELAGRAVLTSQRAGGGGTNQLRELGPASTI